MTLFKNCWVFLLVLPIIALSSSVSVPPSNNGLQKVIKLGEGLLQAPEDVAIDEKGTLYTASRDGWIRRLYRNGTWEDWKQLETNTLLGIAIAKGGGLLVCDADKGLLKVTDDGVTVLASHLNGSKIRLADDVIEASDGSIYFSVASTKYELHNWYLDFVEDKPHGQLLKYDPSTKQTSILLDDLYFANGVALSKHEHFLLVCETWRFRCLKYWLKGSRKGKTEIFIKNLPGGPDNINLAPDGSFWVAVVHVVPEGLELVNTSKTLKRIIISKFPELVEFVVVNGAKEKATVMNVAANGNIIKRFDDPNGTIISFVTSALEFEENLYLGNLNTNFVGKLPLK